MEAEVQKDLTALGQSEEDFQFFLVFAREVMDGYGRLLGFIKRYPPDALTAEERPLSYNERLLREGRVFSSRKNTYLFLWKPGGKKRKKH